MKGNDLIENMINAFFKGSAPSELVAQCPAGMLWEAIRRENARDIELHAIFDHLLLHDEFFLLPEPIPAIQNGLIRCVCNSFACISYVYRCCYSKGKENYR